MTERTLEQWQEVIPDKFRKSGHHPIVKTVGDLKTLLSELPDDLEVHGDFSNSGAQLVVYNISRYKLAPHLRLCEPDGDGD